jgi:hypothetical protein
MAAHLEVARHLRRSVSSDVGDYRLVALHHPCRRSSARASAVSIEHDGVGVAGAPELDTFYGKGFSPE